ncbi:cation-efflux pump [bacterium]|nr:cation-efflux pump [bacterium]MCI0605385.1 cation-efflux pump [bacterium]
MARSDQAQQRKLTEGQIKQERALALVIWLDMLLIVPYLVVAILVGSLAMIAEVVRGSLLLIVICFSLRTLRRANRGYSGEYDYGIGKLERALSGVVAVLLLFAAGFIIWRAFVSQPESPSSPFLAALAVVFVSLNLGINSYPLLPLWRALRDQPSVIVLSHFRARLAKALGSMVVVSCVAIHMYTSDPRIGQIAEGVGAVMVSGFMIVVAISLLREVLPDMLDRAIAEPMQIHVNQTLAKFFDDYDELIAVRTRRSGNVIHVEITLGFAPDKTMGELRGVVARIQDHLQQTIPNSDILIVPRSTTRRSAE